MLTIYPLMLGTWEIVAIVLVILLLFGGKKIPELMKGLGKGVKSFKQGMNEVEKEIKELDEDGSKKDEGRCSAQSAPLSWFPSSSWRFRSGCSRPCSGPPRPNSSCTSGWDWISRCP